MPCSLKQQMNQSNSLELDDIFIDVPVPADYRQDLSESLHGADVQHTFECSGLNKPRGFQPNLRERAKALEVQLSEACEKAAKNIFIQNGYRKGVECQFRFHRSYRVSIKPAAGSGNAFNAIIQTIFTREGALQTQAFVRSKAQEMCPTASITKNWNQPLQPWAIKKVMTRVLGLGAPFDKIKIKKGATLNDLHAASKTAVEKFKGGAQSFTPTVLMSDTHLIVNGVPFSISTNKSGGKEYPSVRVSTLKLLQALQKR